LYLSAYHTQSAANAGMQPDLQHAVPAVLCFATLLPVNICMNSASVLANSCMATSVDMLSATGSKKAALRVAGAACPATCKQTTQHQQFVSTPTTL
jgi:hypothetical protein